MNIKTNLSDIKQRLARLSKDVELVAVSKFQDSDKIIQAIEAGQRIFGENRVQEAHSKWVEIKKQYPEIKLHLIGSLQTNKSAEAIELFDIIESLDRPKLADSLLKEMQRQNKFIPCLIQVNIGREPQKSGILPENADEFINYCINKGLNIKGLMCVPPEGENPEPYFKNMQILAKKHALPILSMGMSSDFETAIKHGATHVRVGTAIFGSRN
jgi:pyridoxal phosphate enzyme (YggS family)